jgi:bifunctional DNase/RNase
MSDKFEVDLHSDQELVEVFPFGVTLAADEVRPIMLFRDADEKLTLPVWLSPLDAGISLSQEFQKTVPATPHRLTHKLLNELGVNLEQCLFVEIKGHVQIVELKFKGDERLQGLRHRADECISFCLFSKAKFFVPRWFVQQSRELKTNIDSLQQGLNLEPGIGRNQHPYMM